MKLLYLNFIFSRFIGVPDRIRYQSEILSEFNIDMKTAIICSTEVTSNLNNVNSYPIISSKHKPVDILKASFLRWKVAYQIAAEQNCNYILLRYPGADPWFAGFARRFSVITEHHSKEIPQLRLDTNLLAKAMIIFEWAFAKKCLTNVKGIIGVTDEIREYELARLRKNKHSVTIANGVNVEKISLKKSAQYDGKALNLIFVANYFSKWHGVDRLFSGIRRYGSKKPVIRLHLVGNVSTGILDSIKYLNIEDRVILHGPLQNKDLDNLFDQMHIAIGSLGVHRKGLRQACTLKVREYTARGIPFVISYKDVDLVDGLPFYLNFHQSDEPVDVAKIVCFADSVLKVKDMPVQMRDYAQRNMDWRVKLKKLVLFLDAMSF
jgi:glycosyltransferase involved in cell wall biosynthesis